MSARIAYLSTGAARCTFPYSAGLVEAIKRLVPATHRRYDPDDHSWTVEPPYGPRVSLVIAEVYPDVEIEHGASVRAPGSPPTTIDPDYCVLHLLPTAPPELVESAYRTLARLHHPDAGGSTDTMTEINSAVGDPGASVMNNPMHTKDPRAVHADAQLLADRLAVGWSISESGTNRLMRQMGGEK